ncbi:hypothetical protein ACTVCO_06500 [Sanguibacter sp. A247]|uniref:hypothetical protein n=1 Tax=unclassified Sanguibacter TaxID=2645534 RepID=UPI003FD884F1
MSTETHRSIGEALSPLENTLLDILCSGEDAASSIARAQRATATWGGYEHEGCECFLVAVAPAEGSAAIEHDGGPFALAEVSDGAEALGLLELWVVDGRLHSVNYMPFGNDHSALPAPDDYAITLIDPA